MCDKELLVAYVYDELQGAERKAFQHHLVSCLECREEVQGLRATRGHLASWTAPETTLDLTMPGTASRAARGFRIAPGWALAAAATLLLALGSALANVEIRTGDGAVTIRAGRASAAAPAPAADADTREALAAVQQRVRDLEAALAAQPAREAAPVSVSPAAGSADARDEAELLRLVRQLISESEGRQQQQLATRLVQVMREMQAEHTMDLARIEQTINQHQAVSSDEIFRQREEMKQFYRLVNQR